MIEVTDVSRAFSGHLVLDGVSLSVEPGTVVAIRGRNGVGKTTLLRILAGVLVPDSGLVTVCGGPPGRGQANFVPAGDRMLNWRLSGRNNLRFFSRIRGTRRSAVEEEIRAAAAALAASDLLDAPVGTCSTGQRRRLMLATALIGPAPVALLDEPYADLDDEGREAVGAACAARAANGDVVLYATPHADGPPPDAVIDIHPSAEA